MLKGWVVGNDFMLIGGFAGGVVVVLLELGVWVVGSVEVLLVL